MGWAFSFDVSCPLSVATPPKDGRDHPEEVPLKKISVIVETMATLDGFGVKIGWQLFQSWWFKKLRNFTGFFFGSPNKTQQNFAVLWRSFPWKDDLKKRRPGKLPETILALKCRITWDFFWWKLPSLKLTASWPLKMDGWNTTFLLGRPIFRGYVSYREGISFVPRSNCKIPFTLAGLFLTISLKSHVCFFLEPLLGVTKNPDIFWLFSGNFCEVSTFYANVLLAPAFFKPIPGAIAGSFRCLLANFLWFFDRWIKMHHNRKTMKRLEGTKYWW